MLKRNEIKNIVQPTDSSKPHVIMVYSTRKTKTVGRPSKKPLFKEAISCSSKGIAKHWLKKKGYDKHKELGYYINEEKDRIANILPTKEYR